MGAIHFGIDGWRERYDQGFDEESVARVAHAAALALGRKDPAGTLYVGYDTRRDGRRYAELAAAVASGQGLRAVLSEAPAPISALGWTARNDPRSVGALMITAGHAPADVNGVKVRCADGGPGGKEFHDALDANLACGPVPVRRDAFATADLLTPYIEGLSTLVNGRVIANAQLKVVIDALHGAASPSMARLLAGLGVEVAEAHPGPAEDFAGLRPEPVEPWTSECQRLVQDIGATAGLCFDGDADRLVAIDGSGRLVSTHLVIALIMSHLVKNRGLSGRVVATTSSSVLVRRQAALLGCPLAETSVGFRWIYAEMLRGGVLLGAEEPGGIGFPHHLPERDGLYAGLLLCELMATTSKTLAQLLSDLEDQVGHMEYGRRDVRLDSASLQMFLNMLPGLNPARVAGMRPVEVSHRDGLRLSFANGSWLLVRAAGTDALVRVYAEAPSAAELDDLLSAGCSLAAPDMWSVRESRDSLAQAPGMAYSSPSPRREAGDEP